MSERNAWYRVDDSWELLEADIAGGVCAYVEKLKAGFGEDCHGDYGDECWSNVAMDVFIRAKALSEGDI